MKKKNKKKTTPVKKSRFISDIVTIVLFLAVIFGFAVAFIVKPDVDSNGFDIGLQRFPDANSIFNEYKGADYLLHGEMATDMDEYFCDQFPLRKDFVTLKAWAEDASLRSINNGVLDAGQYLLKVRFDAVGVGKDTEFYSKEHVQTSLEHLKTVLDGLDVPADVILPPRAVDVVGPSVGYPTYTGDMLNAQANEILGGYYVDVMDTLRGLMDEWMQPYFATDHHWTPVGAFYAMEQWMAGWNDINPQFESYDYEPVKFDFLGTSARNGNYFDRYGEVMDVIRFGNDHTLTVEIGKNLDKMQKHEGLYNMSALDSPDPYNVYLYGKSDYTRITDPTQERETVLVVKDSFAHVFVPHLARYYDVVMVDLDLVNNINLSALVEKTGASRVLVMYNFQNVIETERLKTLR